MTLIIKQKKRAKAMQNSIFKTRKRIGDPHFLRRSFVVGHFTPAVATPYIDAIARLCHKRFLCMLFCLLHVKRGNPTQIHNIDSQLKAKEF